MDGDIQFIVHGRPIRCHRCVLAARCAYFNEMFNTRWSQRSTVVIKHRLVNVDAFVAVMQYIYTGIVVIYDSYWCLFSGQLETPVNLLDDIKRLARQCKLHTLHKRLLDVQKEAQFFRMFFILFKMIIY